jgi:hypothetical protein
VNQEIKDRWINALESGEYVQGVSALHTVSDDGVHHFCCLGVLSDLAYREGVVDRRVTSSTTGERFYLYGECSMMALPPKVAEWAGLRSINPQIGIDKYPAPGGIPTLLSYLNDHHRLPFANIAIVIKEHL